MTVAKQAFKLTSVALVSFTCLELASEDTEAITENPMNAFRTWAVTSCPKS